MEIKKTNKKTSSYEVNNRRYRGAILGDILELTKEEYNNNPYLNCLQKESVSKIKEDKEE